MRKQIIAGLLLGFSINAYSQGTVAFENFDGGGLVIQDGVAYAGTYTVALYGGALGSSFAQLTLLSTFTVPAGSSLAGQFFTGTEFHVAGVIPGNNATLDVIGWDGSYANYAAAVAAGGTEHIGNTGTFSNPTGGVGTPPTVGSPLTGMPDLVLLIPEPSVIVLAGLGSVALWLFRRRK